MTSVPRPLPDGYSSAIEWLYVNLGAAERAGWLAARGWVMLPRRGGGMPSCSKDGGPAMSLAEAFELELGDDDAEHRR